MLLAVGAPGLAVAYVVLVAPIALAGRARARRSQREALDEAGLALTTPARSWLAPLVSLAPVHTPAALWARTG